MLYEAKNACYEAIRPVLWRRYRFVAGAVVCRRSLGRRAHAGQARLQAELPVAVAEHEDRCYWWFHGRFWWEDERLAAGDVMALVLDRERRRERRLERARAAMAGERAPGRPGIRREVKQAVWAGCGGRCVECGADSLLEFDHIIPLAMGGSSGAGNLQLLCGECNRAKGASL